MKIEKSLELLKKNGVLPKENYHSINNEIQCNNSGKPCGGACAACGAC